MKQTSEKYSIAWFKLAEFVSRGEKERAMGLYRLLAHSIEDRALAHQLEGDLLRSFDDEAAVDRYERAAQTYKAKGRHMEAAAVYEHLVLMCPDVERYKKEMTQLYEKLNRSS